jgi:hypothetical protein
MRARLQEAVEDLLGQGISETIWEQVSLPIRLGGLGISDPLILQPAARLAALLNLGMRGTQAVGVPASALATPARDLEGVMQRLQAQLGPNADPLAGWLAGTTPLSSAAEEHTTQKWWAEKVADMQSHKDENVLKQCFKKSALKHVFLLLFLNDKKNMFFIIGEVFR